MSLKLPKNPSRAPTALRLPGETRPGQALSLAGVFPCHRPRPWCSRTDLSQKEADAFDVPQPFSLGGRTRKTGEERSEQEQPLRLAPGRGGRTRRRLLPARWLACSRRWLFLAFVPLPCHRRLLLTELCQQIAWAQLPSRPGRGVWTLSYRQSPSQPPCTCKMARAQSGPHVLTACAAACSHPPPGGLPTWASKSTGAPMRVPGEEALCPWALHF